VVRAIGARVAGPFLILPWGKPWENPRKSWENEVKIKEDVEKSWENLGNSGTM